MSITALIATLRRRAHLIKARRFGVPLPLIPVLRNGHSLSIVDVGAHIGSFTKSISASYSINVAILVEAQKALVDRLSRDFTGPNFRVIHAAVTDKSGTTILHRTKFEPAASVLMPIVTSEHMSLIELHHEDEICPAGSLDELLAPLALEIVDLVKIDVQGAEHLVLAGGRETLARTRVLWVEVSFERLYEGACLFHEVYGTLSSMNFGLRDLAPVFRGPSGDLVQADALFVARK